MSAPAMKTLRVSLVDLGIVPAGPGGTVSGEVWVRLTKQVRTVDGQVVVLAAARQAVPATGVVDFEVPANNDAGIMADDRGFGVVVGWDLTSRGARGSVVTIANAGTTVLVTSASPSTVAFSSLAEAVPEDALSSYPTEGEVDAKIANQHTADNLTYVSYFTAPSGGDDAPALQAAMTALGGSGGVLILQRGSYSLRSQIQVPNKVTLRGQGRSASTLEADPVYFPTSTPVVRLGDGTVGLAFSSRIEHLGVAANGVAGSIGVYSTEAQEMCGASFCIISGFTDKGIDTELGCANIEIDNCEIYPDGAGANYGIFLNDTFGASVVRRCTLGVSGHLTYGLVCGGGSMVALDIHVQNCVDGIYWDGGQGAAIGITGPTASSDVTNLIRMSSSSRYVTVVSAAKNGATHTVQDDFFGKTIDDQNVLNVTMGEAYTARLVHYGDTAGFFGATPVARAAALTAAAAASPAGGTGAAAGAWDTAANRNIAIATINNTATRITELETRLRAYGLLP